MAKYKVRFSGFAYVEANSPEEAMDEYEWSAIYEEISVDSVEEVEEFGVRI